MLKLKIISKKQYDELIDLLKRSLDVVKTLEAERYYYKRSWEDLQSFCMTFSKDKNIDFPATTKIEPENKIY